MTEGLRSRGPGLSASLRIEGLEGSSMLRNVVLWIVLAGGLAACAKQPPPATGQAEPVPERAWVTLFDGNSLDHWTTAGDANWQLAEGAVVADSGTGFLVSREVYGDFDLQLEFFVTPDAN